jgi:hypothetical protein
VQRPRDPLVVSAKGKQHARFVAFFLSGHMNRPATLGMVLANRIAKEVESLDHEKKTP